MNGEVSLKSFGAWVVAGMGLHIGWGLITIVVYFAAKAVGVTPNF